MAGDTILITCYLIKTNLFDTICYGIPNAIIFPFFMIYLFNFVTYQFLIFYIICLYLNMKINSLNERLLEMQRRKRFIRIREILQSFDSIYSEIDEYNTTFWSKILFFFCTILGSAVVFILYSFFVWQSWHNHFIHVLLCTKFLVDCIFIHNIHGFVSHLLCEQIIQNIEFIYYIVF